LVKGDQVTVRIERLGELSNQVTVETRR
jgi:2-keto-4-pentenoate hydratase/2-oxohepta-3-ene-1,7-dioic acid hydratase in catechol pathway